METIAKIIKSENERYYLAQKRKPPLTEEGLWHIKEIKKPSPMWGSTNGPIIEFVKPDAFWIVDLSAEEIEESIRHYEKVNAG
jgi:hypothetical protein